MVKSRLRRRKEKAAQKQKDKSGEENTTECAKVLVTVEPEGLCVIGEGECECIELAVDSGATETVIGEQKWCRL